MSEITSIEIEGESFSLDKFSTRVQDLVALRNRWQLQLVVEQEAALKTEAAIKRLDQELAQLVQNELRT